MALRDIGENGAAREVKVLDHLNDFNRDWDSFTGPQRTAIEGEINRRLDGLLTVPNPNWGSITNTSLQGGEVNPATGIRGDWSDTPFQPIFEHFRDERMSALFYGNVWKKVIIERDELWIGIRSDPTFPQRGITLQGKTYFIHTEQ
jgi:hypothetical protein